MDTDTICNISTPAGSGAIAIIRLSGKNAITIAENFFIPFKKIRLQNAKGYTIHFGKIVENDNLIDQVLLSIFRKNQSYTGEDLVEIACHGSVFIQQKILELLVKNNARLAQPGEFTQRAFLNGKMDLSQAEAVTDLIATSNSSTHKMAIQQMKGGYSKEINKLRSELLEFISLIELELDFGEEDVEFADRKKLKILLIKISDTIEKLKNSFQQGNALKNGIPVVIVGETNVGKSTLLNKILNEEKAIVSHIKGTTRDIIEDTINIEGIGFRFIDTAGLRKTTGLVENIGIERAYNQLEKASIVLLMLDAQQKIDILNEQISQIRKKISTQKLFIVPNKIDKITKGKILKLEKLILQNYEVLCLISAKENINLRSLIKYVVESAKDLTGNMNDIVVSNARHFEALRKTGLAIERSINAMDENLSVDLLTQDIREAIHYLSEITGLITSNEILESIFSRFCIGK